MEQADEWTYQQFVWAIVVGGASLGAITMSVTGFVVSTQRVILNKPESSKKAQLQRGSSADGEGHACNEEGQHINVVVSSSSACYILKISKVHLRAPKPIIP